MKACCLNQTTPPTSVLRRGIEGLGRQIYRYAAERSYFPTSAGSCQAVPRPKRGCLWQLGHQSSHGPGKD